jgi:sulfate adenylyltransferase subunit 1 (EFTu-like GTPase family)
LRAEREQGITIDVAPRFFTTPRRSFILAGTGPLVVDGTRPITEGVAALEALLRERGVL